MGLTKRVLRPPMHVLGFPDIYSRIEYSIFNRALMGAPLKPSAAHYELLVPVVVHIRLSQ